MRVPQIRNVGLFGVQKIIPCKHSSNALLSKVIPDKDSVCFSSSTARYLKKYNTLPDEIKRVLSPKDAIDMFKDMEITAARGKSRQRRLIGQSRNSDVYENPWLKDYYLLVSKDKDDRNIQIIYSRHSLGDAVWKDNDNSNIQLIAKLT